MTGSDKNDRLRALSDLEATLLVEAAAGTGKTSLLAGRLTFLLASGVAPRNVASITFTELAAGELRVRVGRFIDELLAGIVASDLRIALPHGLKPSQCLALAESRSRLDEVTSTTIHGFCHGLLQSYAIEAGVDPGAQILDVVEADLAFRSVFEKWLTRRLGASGRVDDPVMLMAEGDPSEAVKTLRDLGNFRRRFRSARPFAAELSLDADRDFVESVRDFRRWFGRTPGPDRAEADISDLERLAEFYQGAFKVLPSFGRLWELAHPPRVDAMRRNSFDLRLYQRRGVWQHAGGKPDGQRLAEEAASHYARCCDAFRVLLGRIATSLVSTFASELDELLADFEQFKRNAAVLDFDDLLLATRRLLRTHEEVRRAISARFTRILIDEFQDTDPVQSEILFLIASESADAVSWQERKLVPGQLFMVGDPKQAIYRFRGADVASYLEARGSVARQFPGNILRVTSNFRSRADILNHVNRCFAERLKGQAPGYVALEATLAEARHGLPCVAKVTIDLGPQSKAAAIRDAEASSVAEICARLIGNISIRSRDGKTGPLLAGDIALLAPAGTELWRYERALEDHRVPFVSQAGRNLFRRQEALDLLALVRTLADGRDTLAFGALLRGPLVGLTEQELLDIVGALPCAEANGEVCPRLTPATDPELVGNPVAREVLTILRDVRRRVRSTTPFLLLSEVLERLRARPVIAARNAEQASRSLTNVDLLMERARAYSARGLMQLTRDLQADWELGAAYDEGRVDTQGEAVEIVTVHSSKGLEWPVVIPINLGSEFRRREPFIYRRRDDTLHWVLGDVAPPALADAIRVDDQESAEERERLLYVACTRAMELLILPRLCGTSPNSWAQLLDLKHGELPELKLSGLAPRPTTRAEAVVTAQSAEQFRDEQLAVTAACQPIRWLRPSEADPDRQLLDAVAHEDMEQADVEVSTLAGSAVRGLVLHKLMEEFLSGETEEAEEAVKARVVVLLYELGASTQPSESPDAEEIAATALRTFALPALAERRRSLVPEIPVYAPTNKGEILVAGRADAVGFENDLPTIVFDWKSDVAPTESDRIANKAQVLEYARALGAPRGAVVYMSLGQVHWVKVK